MTLDFDPGLEARARRYGERLLGLFFRAWAHELNNPVQAVLAGAELIDMELGVPGATLESLRAQVGSQARELAVEVLRVSDGIARLHGLSRPVEPLGGSTPGELVLEEAIALWQPVARHLGVRTRRPEDSDRALQLPVPLETGRVLVLGALAAIARAQTLPDAIELRWEGSAARPSLVLAHTGVQARVLDPAAFETLLALSRVELRTRADALELRFASS